VPGILNPFDAYALEMAVRLKEKYGGEITAISMGPAQATGVLKECLSVGADKAILVTDPAFAGSDTLATSYVLAQAIKKTGDFDIVFCGKQAIDGDTAQVGPEIAEHLDIAQVTYTKHVEISGNSIRIERELENGTEIIETTMPILITVTKNSQDPRLPTLKSKLTANRTVIPMMHKSDLAIDHQVGLKGSPTKVKRTFIPQRKSAGQVIRDTDPQEAAEQLSAWLNKNRLLEKV
jgi:electron transfer flavoprotein beta subunit